MKKNILLTIALSTFAITAFAQNPAYISRAYTPEFQCPETHPEYTRLLKNLREFQAKLKADSECQSLSLDMDKFTNLLGEKRESFLDTISKNEDGVLSADSAQEIQSYTSEVTEQVSTLISLISNADGGFLFNRDRCSLSEEDRFSAVQRVTSAAYEASKLISKVAGPYGVPISIAANTAFGVIQGLQNFIKKSEPIDFDQPEKREFFAESLCLFSSFEAEIRKLNNPQGHINSLRTVKENAEKAINQIRYLCPDCNDIFDFEFIDTDDEEELDEQNAELKDLVVKVNEATGLRTKLGSRSIEAKENLAWVNEELIKFSSILDFPTKGIGPRELQSIKLILSDFLLKTASPGFLNWYLRKSHDSISTTNNYIAGTFNEMIRQLEPTGISIDLLLPENPLSPYGPTGYHFYDLDIVYLYFINTSVEKYDYSPSFYSVLIETFEQWKLAEQNAGIVAEYCSFFAKNLFYPRQVQKVCESNSRKDSDSNVAYKAFFLADIFEASKELSVKGPFDFSLSYHIESFPVDLVGVFLNTDRLIEESLSGNSMNLISEKENESSDVYTNWQDASEAHVDDLVSIFRAARNTSNTPKAPVEIPFPY